MACFIIKEEEKGNLATGCIGRVSRRECCGRSTGQQHARPFERKRQLSNLIGKLVYFSRSYFVFFSIVEQWLLVWLRIEILIRIW